MTLEGAKEREKKFFFRSTSGAVTFRRLEIIRVERSI